MTKQEFIKKAKELKGWNVASIRAIRERGNKGLRITYSQQLDDNTVSTEKYIDFWNMELEQIAIERLYN